MSQPLSQIKVLDLSRFRAGPTAVRQLADWGAEVIKIEPPAGGKDDDLAEGRAGSDFQNLQRNKRSLTLNLKTGDGVRILKQLAKDADVLVENFRPDVTARLGIDYPVLRSINPRLIYASISGFGEDGPYKDRPGFDQIAQGMGGLMSITGLPGQGPVRAGIPVADLSAGILCAQGILLALLQRQQSGEGQRVTTSLLQAQVFMLDFQASRWLNDGVVAGQAGNNHPTSIPTGVFKTRDGYINIGAAGQKIWERLCRAIGAEELIVNPDFATGALRSANRDALSEDINSRLAADDSAAWLARLNDAGVPSGPIYSIDQVFADPQAQHLQMVESVASPHYHPLRLLGQPVRLSRSESGVRLRPPELGEHTAEILGALGYDSESIADLRRRGVV
jgi:crotonobetainyl-CoA:carnitine CoA-transferase CaiB-like acyl-CoA transferase